VTSFFGGALSHGGSDSPPVTLLILSSFAEASSFAKAPADKAADESGRPGNEWNTTVFQDWAILVLRAIHHSWPSGPSSFASSGKSSERSGRLAPLQDTPA